MSWISQYLLCPLYLNTAAVIFIYTASTSNADAHKNLLVPVLNAFALDLIKVVELKLLLHGLAYLDLV